MNRPAVSSSMKKKLLEPLERFFQIEASSGIVLLAATIVALALANSPWADGFEHFWHTSVTFGVGSLSFTRSLHFWINEGLMTVFFLLVGMEIRREAHEGVLADKRVALLPLAAAVGGMLIPALLYMAASTSEATARGWAVPTATDIAFAIGVLTLLGRRVPAGVRVLLLAVAIIDDILAILVIAVFYSDGIAPSGLAIAGAGVLGVLAFQRLGVRHGLPYAIPGAVIWAGLLAGGVHPALAGVVLGLLTPVAGFESHEILLARAATALDDIGARVDAGEKNIEKMSLPVQELKAAQRDILPPVVRMQLALHPWVAYGIMPLFALANAGVPLSGLSLESETTMPILVGVLAGLVIGKPLGIMLFAVASVKLRLCVLPPGVDAKGILVIGCLGGIGFTMALFIAGLAFEEESALAAAKVAVLAASALAAFAGYFLGLRLLPRQ